MHEAPRANTGPNPALRQLIGSKAPVDKLRVAAFKAAIADGGYALDLSALASAMVEGDLGPRDHW